jgi:hypothetical protein
MTSKALSQNALFNPETQRDGSSQEEKIFRRITVYDAVAGKQCIRSQIHFSSDSQFLLTPFVGRISSAGFIPKLLKIASTRDTTSTSTTAVSPEAVLFRQKNAPTRYVESDMYFANEQGLNSELPDSDLLKALHCYTSDFYSRATADSGPSDWRSLDETALIALGILMEEAARQTLGQTGDLAFTEGERVGDPNKVPSVQNPPPGVKRTSVSVLENPLDIEKRRRFKRRRIDDNSELN